jgi:hypothetical protein
MFAWQQWNQNSNSTEPEEGGACIESVPLTMLGKVASLAHDIIGGFGMSGHCHSSYACEVF